MKSKLYTAVVIAVCCILNGLHAQTNTFPSTGNAGIGTTSPLTSAALEIKSTSKGLLIPRMTKTQRDSILVSAAAKGLLVYQTNSTPGFYYYNGTAWAAVASKAQFWSLTGNAATDSTVNFIGTTDAHPLVFRVNNVRAGFIGYNTSNTSFGYQAFSSNATGNYNTATGTYSLAANTTGGYNSASGSDALHNNTIGNNNTANGAAALYSNTTGYSNIAIGIRSLYSNTVASNLVAIGDSSLYYNGTGAVNPDDASYNTAIGSKALFNNSTGSHNTANGAFALKNNFTGTCNTAIGNAALNKNLTGNSNTAVGVGSLELNTTGSYNVANGFNTLLINTTGSHNIASGTDALHNNTTGNNNTANGAAALYSNTTGYSNVAVGPDALLFSTTQSNNVAVGDSALLHNGIGAVVNSYDATSNTAMGSKSLYSNTTGFYNTANGFEALYNNTTGNSNTANGFDALPNNGTGNNNTAVGYNALPSNSTGSFNTALGAGADVVGNHTNSTAIGYGGYVNASNVVEIGNSSVTNIGGTVGWTVYSDGRFKKNIQPNVPGLSFITQLKPVTYTFDVRGFNKFSGADERLKQRDTGQAKNNAAALNAINEKAINEKEKIVYTGLVAQDVEQAANKIGYNFSGVHKPQNDKDNYGLDYGSFVVPLIKAVQELSIQNDAKDAKIDTLKQIVTKQERINNDLQRQFDDLKAMVLSIQQCSPCNASVSTQTQSSSTILTDGTSLQQNIPNPFTHSTTIGYLLPQKFTSAQIVITDKSGKTLKAVTLPAGRQGISGSGKGSLNIDASTLASGAYQYSLIVDGRLIDTKQMALAK